MTALIPSEMARFWKLSYQYASKSYYWHKSGYFGKINYYRLDGEDFSIGPYRTGLRLCRYAQVGIIQILQVYSPSRMIFAIPSDTAGLPEALALRRPQGQAVAYVCRGTSCTEPLTNLAEVAAELKNDD